jgi:hypothetical protein
VVSNYVVVGVYPTLNGAAHRIEFLKEEEIEANYIRFGYPDRRELYYVYVAHSSDHKWTQSKSNEYRNKSGFGDTWVFVLKEPDPREVEIGQASSSVESGDDTVKVGVESGLTEQGMEEEVHHEEDIDNEEEAEALAAASAEADSDQYHKLFFRAFYLENGREVPATVKVYDGRKSRLLTSKHSFELVNFLKRKDPEYPLQVVCEAFGYKDEIHEINFSDPMSENSDQLVSVNGDTVFVDFPLYRHNVGDTLYVQRILLQ